MTDGRIRVFGPVEGQTQPREKFTLRPPRPFPARANIEIVYSLPWRSAVRIQVYDVRGRKVRTLVDAARAAGEHLASWDARDGSGNPIGTGLYFVRFSWPGGSLVERAAVAR
jgi:hypothetical protein